MKQVCNGIRIYNTAPDRERAISQLVKRGYNYFARYRDTQGFGLSYGNAAWVKGYVYGRRR